MISVAIDGPAGAGKSTIARAVAAQLGYIYVDTGALYRAIGYYVLENGGEPQQEGTVLPFLRDLTIKLAFVNGEQHVFLNGKDVSSCLRTPEISLAASQVSALGGVLAFLLNLQRDLARENNVVMDGRDIGTVVLPNAQVKIFLTASVQERALRRTRELAQKGIALPFDTVVANIKQRDYQDSHRKEAPLRQASDAVLVDTTGLNLSESIERISELIKESLKRKG